MTTDIHALYEIHRHQLLLNCTRSEKFILPSSYIFALENRMYPYFHENWCSGDDPFLECYEVKKDFIAEVMNELDRKWLAKKVPTFYELESQYGRECRWDLISILRYCYLDSKFDSDFYDRILSPTNHPTEAKGITMDYDAEDIRLV